ncbi:HypC/HybG/HupF family hydrogenase formation chaperone [Anaerotignum sp. MB30-C6]|uniref:HypC/HybG/HupF family hydrogenase formation chaperone n=1 Tax=Anaerotignum sp. MB30-C6 TaxID=3070814 RepID=UPI0027DB92D1|nr:HypC/HybG/HupF family hydrogenase formation chaperone [Anaerotignum sp. MB30-C6]WMI79979.1 HypC/HybG/HupF family hydrogenase formation chaperone [Anaerotignum sp. MB30-C6]
MCLAVPTKITSVQGNYAYAETMGIRQKINIQLIENLVPGEFVLLHAGFAIEKIDQREYLFLKKILNEMMEDDE